MKLSKKRSKYVAERKEGRVVGAPLSYPAGVAEKYQRDLDKLAARMVKEYRRELLSTWRGVAMDASLASQARIALNKLRRRFQALFNQEAPGITENILGRIDKHSKATLEQSLKKLSGGVTLKVAALPGSLADALKASTAENVALIRSIPQQFHLEIEGAVMRSIQPGGRGLEEVTEQISKYEGVTKRRVRIIAQDQTRKITTAINAERAKSAGITKFKWLHSSGSADPRQSHVAANGNVYDYDKPPAIGDNGEPVLPGQAINCHPGDSRIQIPNGCVKLYRRRYSGELLSIVSDDGVILKATPNHPVLTLEGWKAAKDINLGDYLVKGSHKSINAQEGNVKGAVSELAEFFDSAASLIGTCRSLAGHSTLEFHGDASDGEVDIVDIGRLLPNELNPCELEQIRELIFAFADSAFDPLCEGISSSADEFVMTSLLSPDRSVRGLCSLLSELRGKPCCAHDASGRLIAYLDSAFDKNTANRNSGYAVFLGKLKFAHAENVLPYDVFVRQILAIVALGFSSRDAKSPLADSLGQIVGVDSELGGYGSERAHPIEHAVRVTDKIVSEYFSGHVYNLETVSNWYVANGIVTHNCRCVAVPVLDWGDDD